MRIAFDLDDTLIPTRFRFATEPPNGPWWWRPFASEPLRLGAALLLRQLRAEQHALMVYTSSARSIVSVHLLFRAYGIILDGVINLDRHDELARRTGVRRLKNLSAFDIDLLIDDSEAVARDAHAHGERVLVVAGDDPHWADRVRNAIEARGLNTISRGCHSGGLWLPRGSLVRICPAVDRFVTKHARVVRTITLNAPYVLLLCDHSDPDTYFVGTNFVTLTSDAEHTAGAPRDPLLAARATFARVANVRTGHTVSCSWRSLSVSVAVAVAH
jgi:hypothetical protein